MIYLEASNLLFLKPFKVAGTSFEIALSKFAGSGDIVTPLHKDEATRESLGYTGPLNYRYTWAEILKMPFKTKLRTAYHKYLRVKFSQHTNAQTARDRLGPSTFDSAFKVSIVRNPFDYLISHYFWHNNGESERNKDFPTWVRRNPWVLTRNDQFYFVGHTEIIDFYIRFEHFQADIRTLEELKPELKGLYEGFSKVSTKSNIRPPNATVNGIFHDQPELINAVRFFQSRHIGRFDYRQPY